MGSEEYEKLLDDCIAKHHINTSHPKKIPEICCPYDLRQITLILEKKKEYLLGYTCDGFCGLYHLKDEEKAKIRIVISGQNVDQVYDFSRFMAKSLFTKFPDLTNPVIVK